MPDGLAAFALPPAAPRIAQAIARAIAPRKPLTVSQWADAERVLSSKGSAEPGRWRTTRNPPLREPMDCLSVRSTVKDVVLMFPIQFGKALALDTPLPTPGGWACMGDVRDGDVIFGADGRPTRVIATSSVFTDHDCYRVTFSDGAQVVADSGHRWSVIDLAALNEATHTLRRRAREGRRANDGRRAVCAEIAAHRVLLDTQQLAASRAQRNRQARYGVELAAPVELPEADLALDPYVFGCWLGDGHTHRAAITTMDEDILHAFVPFRPTPDAHQNSGRAVTYGLHCGFHASLRALGVLGDKHIPTPYLRASRAQRLALLQGLMDTDGHASARGHVEITSSKPRLAAGILELIRSLGFKPTACVRPTVGADSMRITFAAYKRHAVFRLSRKAAALVDGPSARGRHLVAMRHIVNVEPVASVPTRCLAVDNADHLYLCGREFIPTHNTEVAVNTLGYCMDHHPGPVMVCLPGEVSMEKWVAQKLNPMLESTPAAQRALTSVASRDSANTRTFKDFAGGQLYIEHAGSPQRLKSTSVRTLIVDELDEFAGNIRTGDDPVAMLDGRTSAFPATYKRLYISTPGVQGISRIESAWLASDMRRWYVPCPHCGHEQPLEWSGLHWSPDAEHAYYACSECGVCIEEHHKTDMLARGRWVPEHPERKTRGYHINALYYPIGLGPRWADLVRMWRAAQNDPAKLKTFINDRLAEPWEDPAMRAVKHNIVADRAEPYRLRVAPPPVLAITAGVDTQDNRLAVHITGWGRGLAAWTLDYHELPGDPENDKVWDDLTDLLNRGIEHSSGIMIPIEAVAIDGGGHRTEAVKAYVRARRVRRPMVIFGAVPNNAPVLSKGKLQDVNWRGQYDKRGVHIHHVGTVGIKHLLYARLSTDAEKPADARMVHLSEDLPPEYFTGLVSETFDPRKNRFVKRGGARNEPLDTWVYAYAAAHHPELRLHRLTKLEWDAREARLRARVEAPKDAATVNAPQDIASPQIPRGTQPRRGFVNNWG